MSLLSDLAAMASKAVAARIYGSKDYDRLEPDQEEHTQDLLDRILSGGSPHVFDAIFVGLDLEDLLSCR